MSEKETNSDSIQYATVENAKKCIDNADRLYDDALKTSPPTKAALIELSIEELAKGLMVLYKTPEFEEIGLKADFVDAGKILEDLDGTNFIKTIDDFKIGDFTKRFHPEKLKFIEAIVKLSQQFFVTYRTQMEQLINTFGNNFGQYFSKSFAEPMKITEEELSNLADSKISDLDDIKNDGFYVNFQDGKVIEPKNVPLSFKKLSRIFSFMRMLIQNIIILIEGADILDYNPQMKSLVNKLVGTLPSNSSKDRAQNNIVICSACKHKNPEGAKLCMECGAKLE